MREKAVIVGAGPAGLTAALELQNRADVDCIVLEADGQVGGISKTIEYRGNRMDLGGHRFFSKSDWVMRWWQSILPIAAEAGSEALEIAYQGQRREIVARGGVAVGDGRVMLVRSRLSRIFYRRRFFDYPLKLSWATLRNLGPAYTAAIGASYVRARVAPRRPERTLEDFLINRFGDTLYRTFFKDYTEKVWGVACCEISAEWGAQRIKGLSIGKALVHALAKPFTRSGDTAQKGTETSLIERFLYPRLGPGQMWEEVARRVQERGGAVRLRQEVIAIRRTGPRIDSVEVRDTATGEVYSIPCSYLLSSMPMKHLAEMLQPEDRAVLDIASALPYRDFMTAGLLVRRMRGGHAGSAANGMPPDNWIYVQEPDVKLGRIQVFNNWSPALVADPASIWLGLEYFCSEGDALWSLDDGAFLDLASRELAKIGLIDLEDVLDGTVVRLHKAYPAYFGSYSGIGRVRDYLDGFANLFPVGRNGMHRYNNQDHSMLCAKAAVDCILHHSADKSALWSVNAEDEYHEIASDRSEERLEQAA
jgi:protoporphyrinogen oxidase